MQRVADVVYDDVHIGSRASIIAIGVLVEHVGRHGGRRVELSTTFYVFDIKSGCGVAERQIGFALAVIALQM
jgi:hypothetical protein